MYNLKYRLVIIFLGLTVVAACTEDSDKPEDLIPEDDYIDLIVELQLINTFSQSAFADSISVDSLIEITFDRYGINREQFAASHNYYRDFPEEQKKRIDSAIERLRMDKVQDNIRDTLESKKPIPSSSDTARPPTRPSFP